MEKPRPHFLQDKNIVVAGAGISGLAFAISLHKLWPSISDHAVPKITFFERDPCAVPHDREGYSLSLRSDRPSAGIQTLQKMGMLERLLDVAIASLGGEGRDIKECGREDTEREDRHKRSTEGGGGGFVVWDGEFREVMKIRSKTPEGCPVAGMRIARGNLRRELVLAAEALPGVDIQWGNAVRDVSPTEDDKIEIDTSKGAKVHTGILIAADGSSSKLRALLRPRDKLQFAGPTCIYGTTDLSHAPSGRGDEFGTIVSGKGPALFAAPMDAKSMVWCLSWHVEKPPAAKRQPMSSEDAETLMKEAREVGEPAYGKRFTAMLDATHYSTVNKFNAMDKQSFEHSPDYIQSEQLKILNEKVVFLGDANHAVSPFAGNGANLALMDGWDFAESLVSTHSMEDALKRYDRLAVRRARQVVRISHLSIMVMHSTGWMLAFWMWVLRIVRIFFFK